MRHAQHALRSLLTPHYAISTITAHAILHEPWTGTCAALVFPGGGDLGYCRLLNGAGNRIIRNYVANGGRYIGFCAGGYFGASSCEFEVGNKAKEVTGERELAFFPGPCVGSAFAGFEYSSDHGTRAAELVVDAQSLAFAGTVPRTVKVYANGGGIFKGAERMTDKGVQVLARYADDLDASAGDSKAAAVYCKFDQGAALLIGPHPEFVANEIRPAARGMDPAVWNALEAHDSVRHEFLRACLGKLGLNANGQNDKPPTLTPIHLTSGEPKDVESILEQLEEPSTTINGTEYVKGEQDTFQLQKSDTAWSMTSLTRAMLETIAGKSVEGDDDRKTGTQNRLNEVKEEISDLSQVVKTIVTHDATLPPPDITPHFSHEDYYSALSSYRQHTATTGSNITHFGSPLLYAQVITSTSTLLEKNPTFTNTLPSGAAVTATTQLSGRGRGSNMWVSPPGALMFSTKFTHPLALNVSAPVVFIQYLAAIAVAEAVRTYGISDGVNEYFNVPVRLKWPNDIYALDAKYIGDKENEKVANWRERYVKVGGILVNTSYSGGDYHVILGIGVNLSNPSPTTSLNALVDALAKTGQVKQPIEAMTNERLLARILTCFGELYEMFKEKGFRGDIERMYYRYWLHDDQVVTLESEGGAKARITGVSGDWGLLVAEQVRDDDVRDTNGDIDWGAKVGLGVSEPQRQSGRSFALQSDSNSFDFFKGLIKRKL